MVKQDFFKYLQENFPWVNQETFNKIDIYTKTLREYNQKYNLTRLDGEDKIYSEYFLGSIINFNILNTLKSQKNINVLDIGSGSGIPGILLKIIFPWINLTIIESNGKKCSFMKILSDELNIETKIINERAEVYFRQIEGKCEFDLVTSRAVASINKILELSVPFLKINGHVYLLKSQGYELELKEAEHAIKTLNVSLELTNIQTFESKTYVGLLFNKNQKTDNLYPRDWRLISSKPL